AAGRQARIRTQGHQAVLPRRGAVEPADFARGARGGLPLQCPGIAAASGWAGRILLRQSGVVPESRTGGLRARVDRRAIHFPRRVARGAADVAAPLLTARPARAAVVHALGRPGAAAGAGSAAHGTDERAARGLDL